MIPILGKIADSLSASFSFLNRSESPSNKVGRDSTNSPVLQTGTVKGDVHQTTIYEHASQTRPSLDIRTDGSSGGPDGNLIYFVVRNDGKESARNIQAQFGDGSSVIKTENVPNLIVNESTRISYEYTNTAFFLKKLDDPRLTLLYQAVDGRRFSSGICLIQETRADGRFNISVKLGDSFDKILETPRPEHLT